MSDRPLIKQYVAIANGDMSADIIGSPQILLRISIISYQFVWTGNAVGTFSVQVSNDYRENAAGGVQNAGTWIDLPLDSTATAAGSADNGVIDVHNTGFYASRPKFTWTSSSGTLNVTAEGKVS